MKILDVLQKEAIISDLKAQDKKGILEELVAPIARITGVNHKDLVRVLMDREQLGSTGIGGGIGIPHGKLKQLESLALGFGLSRKGVDFESINMIYMSSIWGNVRWFKSRDLSQSTRKILRSTLS